MTALVAALAVIVALQYVVIAVAVVPRLAQLADEPGGLLVAAKWGAAAFFLGCAVTHAGVALHSLTDDAHDMAALEMLLTHVLPHIAQVVGGATFIAIASRKLDIRVSRKEVAARVRGLEDRLSTVLDASALGAWDVDLETGESWQSVRHARIFGLDEPVPPWSTDLLLRRVHPDDRLAVERWFAEAMVTGAFAFECRIERTDGAIRWIALRGEVARGPSGVPSRILGTVADVTLRHSAEEERLALEHQLQQAQKMEAVGQLAGGVAHDFNNLLTVIAISAELGAAHARDGREAAKQFESIRAAGARAADLTRQLLAFSRTPAFEPRVVDVSAAVTETTTLLRRVLGADTEIVLLLHEDPLPVVGDPTQLGQVVMNLVLNARDAMPDGGTLSIRTAEAHIDEAEARGRGGGVEPGPYVQLSVVDNGIGMDAATQARVFEPFFTTKPAGEGTGLGLSMVYGIVRQAGGCIDVTSLEGSGTTFDVFLPRTALDATGADDRATVSSRGGDEHVLVVEDDDDVRALIVQMLEPLGYRVTSAAAPAEALGLALDDADILLTDVMLPGMNGRELADLLRRERPTLPVIYMSGFTSSSVFDIGSDLEALHFLQKPFSFDSLTGRIREVLDGRRAAQAAPG